MEEEMSKLVKGLDAFFAAETGIAPGLPWVAAGAATDGVVNAVVPAETGGDDLKKVGPDELDKTEPQVEPEGATPWSDPWEGN
jgi:hypothetical protein